MLFASGIRAYYTCSACLFMARRDSEVWDEQVHHVRGDYVCHQVQLVGYLLTNEINIWVSRDEKVIRSSDWQVVIINKLMTVARGGFTDHGTGALHRSKYDIHIV